MRPRKRIILLIDQNEERVGILRFVLKTWQYRVLSARTVASARKLHPGQIDFIVAHAPIDEGGLARLADVRGTRYLICADKRTGTVTDAVLVGDARAPANIIDALRLGVARKRGPKPRSVHQGAPDEFSMFFQRLRQKESNPHSLPPPKKPPVIEDPRNPLLDIFEQDLGWFIELSESFTLGSPNRARCERLLRRLEVAKHRGYRSLKEQLGSAA